MHIYQYILIESFSWQTSSSTLYVSFDSCQNRSLEPY